MTDVIVWTVIELLVNVFDSVVSAVFYGAMLGSRKRHSRLIAGCLFMLIVTGVNMFSLDISINMLITLSLWFVCSIFLFNGKIRKKLFYTLTIAGLFVLSETIGSLILLTFSDIGTEEMTSYGFHRMMGILLSKILFFIFIKILIALKTKNEDKIPFRYWIALMFVPTVGILISILLFQMDWQMIKEAVSLPLLMAVSIGILFVNVLVFLLFENFASATRLSQENGLMQQQMRLQEAHYQESLIEQQETRRLWHDMNNHIMCLQQMQRDRNFEHFDEYIQDLNESLERSHAVCNTNIPVVDTIVGLKYRYAKSCGIKISVKAMLSNIGNIAQMDLCTIISNILDNAIEECQRHDDGKIQFSIFERGNYLVISCTNPIGESSKKKSSLLVSEKNNPKMHGIGLRNVEATANKYNGNTLIDINNFQFTITVNLCLNPSGITAKTLFV